MTTVAGYELQGELGRGGMGVVHSARSPGGEYVAIKLLLNPPRSEAASRFARERRLQAALGEAQGFVPLLDAGEDAGRPFIVMPLLEGGTLRSRMTGKPWEVERVVQLGRDLATAVGRAHAQGIVHRDLKPENVLFTRDGRPLVSDLGIAKHFASDAPGASQSVSLSRHGETRGTLSYMAPEQMRDAKSAGPPADVFALGAILYECLTAEPVYAAGSFFELLEKVHRGDHVPAAQLRPDAPQWLTGLLERALSTNPAARPRDGQALASALGQTRGAHAPRHLIAALLLLASGLLLSATLVLVRSRAPGVDDPAEQLAELAALDPMRSDHLSRLLELASSRDWFVRSSVADVLAKASGSAELEPVLAAGHGPAAEVVALAFQRAGDPRRIDALVRALSTTSEIGVRRAAARALGVFREREPRVTSLLLATHAREGDDPDMSPALVAALGPEVPPSPPHARTALCFSDPMYDRSYLEAGLVPLQADLELLHMKWPEASDFTDPPLEGTSPPFPFTRVAESFEDLLVHIRKSRGSDPTQPIVIVGHGRGCLLAARVAAALPQRVSHLILCAPTPSSAAHDRWTVAARPGEDEVALSRRRFTAEFHDRSSLEIGAVFSGMGQSDQLEGLSLPPYDFATEPVIAQPTLIVGGEYASIGGAKDVELVASRCARPTTVILDCGRMPFQERPRGFLEAVRRFLAR